MTSNKIQVLFIAAVPVGGDSLNVFDELSVIKDTLESKKNKFNFDETMGIDASKFLTRLQTFRPGILHFSGHGTSEGLVFQDGGIMNNDQLDTTFKTLGYILDLVFLSSCYSEQQATVIKKYANNVIGMNAEISNEAAKTFSSSFYNAIGDNKTTDFNTSISNAFYKARADLKNILYQESEIPRLLSSYLKQTITRNEKEYELQENNIFPVNFVSTDLFNSIAKTIKIFEENYGHLNINDFWYNKKRGNLSNILIILNTKRKEYGIDNDLEILKLIRTALKTIPSQIIKQKEKAILETYYKVIMVLKKIFYDWTIDSIQKIQPLSPKETPITSENYVPDFYFLFDSLLCLRNKICQSMILINENDFLNLMIEEIKTIFEHIRIDYDHILLRVNYGSHIKNHNDIVKIITKLNLQIEMLSGTRNFYEVISTCYDLQFLLKHFFENILKNK